MHSAGYTDVERGERGSTEEHLTVTQYFETRALRFGILETLMPQPLARRDRALRWQ